MGSSQKLEYVRELRRRGTNAPKTASDIALLPPYLSAVSFLAPGEATGARAAALPISKLEKAGTKNGAAVKLWAARLGNTAALSLTRKPAESSMQRKTADEKGEVSFVTARRRASELRSAGVVVCPPVAAAGVAHLSTEMTFA